VESDAFMDEIDARFCIEENGAAVRHTSENLIRSAGIKPSTEISPKRVEERIAAMVRQLRLEQPEQSAAGRYHPSISRSQSPAKIFSRKS